MIRKKIVGDACCMCSVELKKGNRLNAFFCLDRDELFFFFNIQINVIYFTSLCKTVNYQVLLVPVTCKFEKKILGIGEVYHSQISLQGKG
jgi:hypothetical protein